MDERVFHIVDVFAEEPYSGNQLAVFLDGQRYTDAEMQKLAREMNFSETTFIFPQESAGTTYKVRIFTPGAELPFAGHPTLGTAFIIARELIGTPVPEVTLDLRAGLVPVAIAYYAAGRIGQLTMRQLPPTFGPTLAAATAAQMLGLPESAVDTRAPAQEVSTGVPFMIVPLRDLDAMRAIRVDAEAVARALAGFAAQGVLVFCPQTYRPENQLNVRVFVPALGVGEDPATGSGNGCLLAYLLRHGILGAGPLNLRVEQGFELGRNAILYLGGERHGDSYVIEVGGKVQHIAQGVLR